MRAGINFNDKYTIFLHIQHIINRVFAINNFINEQSLTNACKHELKVPSLICKREKARDENCDFEKMILLDESRRLLTFSFSASSSNHVRCVIITLRENNFFSP
jgi:hypothetical protein